MRSLWHTFFDIWNSLKLFQKRPDISSESGDVNLEPKVTAYNETKLELLLNSEQVKIRQAQVDKLYEGLKDLAEERRGKLDETLKLYQLQGEIDDLEHWIAQKEVVAGSEDIGQDLAQVEVHLHVLVRLHTR